MNKKYVNVILPTKKQLVQSILSGLFYFFLKNNTYKSIEVHTITYRHGMLASLFCEIAHFMNQVLSTHNKYRMFCLYQHSN